MSVSSDDVRHIALLARLGLDESRLQSLAQELSSILGHIEELRAADTSFVVNDDAAGRGQMALRTDEVSPAALNRSREEFAPSMRDNFFMVPRLATHEDGAEE